MLHNNFAAREGHGEGERADGAIRHNDAVLAGCGHDIARLRINQVERLSRQGKRHLCAAASGEMHALKPNELLLEWDGACGELCRCHVHLHHCVTRPCPRVLDVNVDLKARAAARAEGGLGRPATLEAERRECKPKAKRPAGMGRVWTKAVVESVRLNSSEQRRAAANGVAWLSTHSHTLTHTHTHSHTLTHTLCLCASVPLCLRASVPPCLRACVCVCV